MRNLSYLFLILVIVACGQNRKTITPADIKARFGEFEPGEMIKLKPVDVASTPVGKKIEHHLENYAYLDAVDISSIVYSSDGLMVTGFLVKPKKVEGKLPVIVYNRGGNQEMGRLLVMHAVEVLAPLAAEGFVVVGSNYRGNSGSEGKEEFGGSDVRDVSNLITAIGQIAEADEKNVGLLGMSRGGMMSYLTLKNDTTGVIKCMANLGGITDLVHTIEYHPEIGEVCKWLIPDYENNKEGALQERSAVRWVDQLPTEVPILILHGTADKSVDYGQIPVFTDSLLSYGIPHKVIAYEGDNHGCVDHLDDVMQNIKGWFNANLKEASVYSASERLIVNN